MFLQYLLAFQDMCCASKDTFDEKCSLEAMQQVGIGQWVRDDIAECVQKSNITVEVFMGQQISVNSFLQEDRKRREQLGLVINPGFVINNMTYRGDIEAQDIFRAICSGFAGKPDICRPNNFMKIDNNDANLDQ